jgi:hypothetical protein
MSEMPAIIVHIALAVSFFYLLNWIGRHSVSLGYLQLSIFARQDEAPAFNFILRTASPTVFIIVVSAIMYAVGEDNLVKGIWRVVPIYFIFRALFNVAFGRARLIDWRSFISQGVIAVATAWFLYDKLILTKRYIIPDAETLANNLWLIIILFLYSVLNRIQTSSEGTRRRKLRYLTDHYLSFRNKYGDLISQGAANEHVKCLVYAIMIYENFGRPRIVRNVEGLIPRKALTRGIMQVRSTKRITDEQSVSIALEKINRDFLASITQVRAAEHSWMKSFDESRVEEMFIDQAIRKTIVSYNKDQDYVGEVQMLITELKNLDKMKKV